MKAVTTIISKAPETRKPIPRLGRLFCAVFLFALCALSGRGQADPQSPAPSSQTAPVPATTPSSQKAAAPDGKANESAGQKPMSPEDARQAQIVADTNKLYQLAQELQAEVAKSSKNTLSLSVVKKAAEVEKLARSLKERMKTE